MGEKFLNGLASSGGNILVLLALVVLFVFKPTPNADTYINLILGGLLALCTGNIKKPPTPPPSE